MTRIVLKGGAGSGNHGHGGRPGKVGGSTATKLRGLSDVSLDSANQTFTGDLSNNKGSGTMKDFMDGRLDGQAGPSVLWADSTNFDRVHTKIDIQEQVYNRVPADMKAPPGTYTYGTDHRTLVDKDAVGQVVTQWAKDSNDSNKASLSVQEAASEEFGVPMSQFQQAKIGTYVVGGQYRPGIIENYERASNMTRQAERTILRAQYNNTQAQLQAAGYKPTDTVRLYRGIRDSSIDINTTANYQGNALESWSISPYIARGFGGAGNDSRALVAEVPVSSIFSTARTGNGCLNEGEVVVFGSIPGSIVTVVHPYGD